MIRPAAAALALCGCLGLATGCWGAPALDRQGMVSIMGVDGAPHGGVWVTVDMVNATGLPPPTSSGGGGNTGEPVLVKDAVAPSLGEALGRIADSSQMSLDLTHMEAIVVGEDLARRGMADALEKADRSGELTITSWLLITHGATAHDVLRLTRAAAPQPGTALLETAQYSAIRSCCAAKRLLDFVVLSAVPGYDFETAAVAPALADGLGKRAGFRIRGMEVFRGDRLVGMLSPDAALGFLLLSAQVRQQILTVPSPFGNLTIELQPGGRRVRVHPTPHGPVIEIALSDKGRLVGMPVTGPDLSRSPAEAQMLETLAAHRILRLAEEALTQLRAAHSDPLGLGQEVRVDDPADWRREGAYWEERAFSALPMRLRVRFTLTRPGVTLCPLTRPCGRVVTPLS